MQTGAITGYFDVAQLTLYAFWIFFAGLILYLRREDKREGYPLDSDRTLRGDRVEGFPGMPKPKTFILPHGHTQVSPRVEPPSPAIAAIPAGPWPGAPLHPTGNPMIDAVGPAAYAMRHDEPDLGFEDGLPKIVPLRTDPVFYIEEGASDPRGMDVVGADGIVAGKVADLWIDRADVAIRFFEVELAGTAAPHHVLLPVPFSRIHAKARKITVNSILAAQFATVPGTKNPDTITLREEDRITAYYGGGTLYATIARQEPFL
jgi:photosynthetic reaction center H subunit